MGAGGVAGLQIRVGVTTRRRSDQVWDGLKYSDSERLQKLEGPDEIVNLVFWSSAFKVSIRLSKH